MKMLQFRLPDPNWEIKKLRGELFDIEMDYSNASAEIKRYKKDYEFFKDLFSKKQNKKRKEFIGERESYLEKSVEAKREKISNQLKKL